MTHRMSDAEYAAGVRAAGGGESKDLAALRSELAALDRITARHPELSEHNAKRRERIEAEISQLEGAK